jgi:hypothetical protein
MRRHRERRRTGARVFSVVLRETQLDTLIHFRWMPAHLRHDPHAVQQALSRLLDHMAASGE